MRAAPRPLPAHPRPHQHREAHGDAAEELPGVGGVEHGVARVAPARPQAHSLHPADLLQLRYRRRHLDTTPPRPGRRSLSACAGPPPSVPPNPQAAPPLSPPLRQLPTPIGGLSPSRRSDTSLRRGRGVCKGRGCARPNPRPSRTTTPRRHSAGRALPRLAGPRSPRAGAASRLGLRLPATSPMPYPSAPWERRAAGFTLPAPASLPGRRLPQEGSGERRDRDRMARRFPARAPAKHSRPRSLAVCPTPEEQGKQGQAELQLPPQSVSTHNPGALRPSLLGEEVP